MARDLFTTQISLHKSKILNKSNLNSVNTTIQHSSRRDFSSADSQIRLFSSRRYRCDDHSDVMIIICRDRLINDDQ